MKKRILSLFLVGVLLLAAFPQVPLFTVFAEEEPIDEGEFVTEINPLYADVLSENELVFEEEPPVRNPNRSSYSSVADAAAYVRQQMCERNTRIEFELDGMEMSLDLVSEVADLAMAHTGGPTEGDYLKYQYAGRSRGVNGNTGIIKYNYFTTASQEQQVDNKVKSVISNLNLGSKTTEQKTRAIYDYICTHVKYDNSTHSSDYYLQYTAYGALINGTCVCQGYAVLLYRLLLEAGIDSRVITGTGTNSLGTNSHAWNIVRIGSKYYYLDATWDTTYYATYKKYNFYLRGSNNFKDHVQGADCNVTGYNISIADYDGSKAIIVIPGITGSELFVKMENGSEEKAWVNENYLLTIGYARTLALDKNGNSIKQVYVKDESISPYGTRDIYKNLVTKLDGWYSKDYDVRFFSYDWRLTNTKAAEQLNAFVSDYDSVIFVCHSMGGIVASLYMANYGYDKVDKLITLGTPYFGAPKAIYALESGFFLDGALRTLAQPLIQELAPNMPGVYELIPNKGYYKNGNYCILNFQTGKGYTTYGKTKQLLQGRGWYNSVVYNNSESVFTKQYRYGSIEAVYGKIMNKEIDGFVIVGYNQKTLTCISDERIDGWDADGGFDDIDVNLCGDGTVPLISSTLNFAQMKRQPYYIDGKDYWADGKDGINHSQLATDDRTIQLVKNIIDGKGDSSQYAAGCGGIVSRNISISKGFTGYKIKAACPVTLSVMDNSGNTIGTVSSEEITAIEGHDNDFYICGDDGDIKIAFVDEESYKNILIQGYANGTMDLEIVQYDNGIALTGDRYNNVEVTEKTVITTVLGDNKIQIDKNNDGKTDAVSYPEHLPCFGGKDCPGTKFLDMPAKGNWAHDAIDWAVVNGITSGTSATKFSPNAGCTRAQVVTFLWRAAGSLEPATTTNPFKDVKSGSYYYKAVLWAVEKKVTAGTSATTFSPDATCTRGQIVTFLWRYQGNPAAATATNPFKDVKSTDFYYDAVLWASENGVTAGTSATTFSPSDTCTRAQIVTFLYRTAKLPSVQGQGDTTTVNPIDITLNKTSLSLVESESETLTATVSPSNATDKTVTWSSSNTSVATVTSSGKVTAKAAGTATITAKTVNGKTATCSIQVIPLTVSGNCGANGDNLKWSLNTKSGTLTITGGGDMANWTSEAPAPWYSYGSYIKTVDLPGSLTSIGDYAFIDCSNLTEAEMLRYVTKIGRSAFENCKSLKSMAIPDSVTNIDYGAFFSCENLAEVTIMNGVEKISVYAFGYCKSLKSIAIPSSVSHIGAYAFSDCNSLTSVVIQNPTCFISRLAKTLSDANKTKVYCYAGSTAEEYASTFDYSTVTYAENMVFGVCGEDGDNVTWKLNTDTGTLIISGSGRMKDYEDNAYGWAPWFGYTNSIKNVSLLNGLTNIGDWAFEFCSSLKNISIPSTVTEIGEAAFFWSGLTSIAIPGKVTKIGSWAFSNCQLTTVTIPESVTSVDSCAFYACDSLTSVTVLNRNCEIFNSKDTLGAPGQTTIHGYSGSTAQSYAGKYGYTFQAL